MHANTKVQKGFLSPAPLKNVPPFERVSELARNLPQLITAGSAILRKEIHKLHFVDTGVVQRTPDRLALMRDYHYLQSAYVRADPDVFQIPVMLARPSFQLASWFHIKPVLSYASMILENWEHVDSDTFSIENIRPIVTFTDTQDEVAFLMSHVLIENEAAEAIEALQTLPDDLLEEREEDLIATLEIIAKGFARMRMFFENITKQCEPRVYFDKIRIWFGRFEKIIFAGVPQLGDKPHSFIGASGAQSSILPAVDAALSIRHKPNSYVNGLRKYMIREHVIRIEELEMEDTLRDFIQKSRNADLRRAYNEAVQSVLVFRLDHIAFTKHYIEVHDANAPGTGGSNYLVLLTQYVKDTEAALLL